jgi:hypothetical protein
MYQGYIFFWVDPEVTWEYGGIVLQIFNSGQLQAPVSLPGVNAPVTQWISGGVGYWACLEAWEKKVFVPDQKSNYVFSVNQPVS